MRLIASRAACGICISRHKKSIKKLGVAATETAHWVKAPTTKADELGSVMGIHMVGGEI